MIGIGFILRILEILLYVVIGAALLWLIIFIISKVIQWTVAALGHEIGDFGSWFFGLFKKK